MISRLQDILWPFRPLDKDRKDIMQLINYWGSTSEKPLTILWLYLAETLGLKKREVMNFFIYAPTLLNRLLLIFKDFC